MTVRELKALCTERRVDFADCVQKGDLVARAIGNGGLPAMRPCGWRGGAWLAEVPPQG